MKKYSSRDEVPEKYKWDLKEFFKDDKEYEETYDYVKKSISKYKEYRKCFKDAKKLKEFLDFDIDISSKLENLYVYAFLKNDEVLGVSKSIERKNKIENLCSEAAVASSFFNPGLLKLEEKEFEKLINDPILKEFKVKLKDIYRLKGHNLSEEKEIIVSRITNSMNHFEDLSSTMLNGCHKYGFTKDKDGKKIEIAPNNYRHLLKTSDAKNRKSIYKKYNKVLDQYSTLNATYLNSYVAMNNELAKIYNFKSSWDEHLFSIKLNDNIFKTLVSTVERNLNILHKYYKLKKDVFKSDKLHVYDLPQEIAQNNKEYSIEDAQDICRKALSVLGEDYISKYDNIVNKHYIDYCQYKGKCSGGYSFATSTIDSRILLSFNGSLDSVSTIIHEAGHNIHHQYIKDNNLVHYRNVPNVICEVASLTNECLLSSYLANNGTTIEEKKAGISNILDVIVSNLYGAVREGKMEEDMYKHVLKGNTLTKEYMDKLSRKSLKKYYGGIVTADKNIKNDWVRRSHYYMNFYLYSYSICICVASYVAKNILEGNKKLLNNYLEFLKTGSEKEPIETFNVLGIDLENPKVYEDAIKYFDEMIEKFKSLEE